MIDVIILQGTRFFNKGGTDDSIDAGASISQLWKKKEFSPPLLDFSIDAYSLFRAHWSDLVPCLPALPFQ